MTTSEESIRNDLFDMRDPAYRDFQARLIPNIDKNTIIGVRTPELRKYAAAMRKNGSAEDYLRILPHEYYEENNLHGLLISQERDPAGIIARLDVFLPYVDNWATCDLIIPRALSRDLTALRDKIHQWLDSEHTYTVRFGIGMLMKFYLDDAFSPEYLEWVADVKSDEYYVNMMAAWYFATALDKQYDAALPYLRQRRLSASVHTKTIQKAIESRRVSPEHKEILRSLSASPKCKPAKK